MNTLQITNDRSRLDECPYALSRHREEWHLIFEGQTASFEHELGALYVAYLLLNHSREPLHAVALAFKAREWDGHARPEEVVQEGSMGLKDAAEVKALWRRQRELERVLADSRKIEPVKAEALRELEEVTQQMRANQWLSAQGAERCVRAVGAAIKRFHADLLEAVDAEGRPQPVLRDFAGHLQRHLLSPSGRGCRGEWRWLALVPAGCFIYLPPSEVVWNSPESRVLSLGSVERSVHSPRSTVHSPQSHSTRDAALRTQDSRRDSGRRLPAALGFLSRFLCAGFALALLVTGCAGPRPLKGGKAAITRRPTGVIEQTVVQGENASQPSKQDQETVKVRTYTLPAASRIEQCQVWEGERPREPKLPRSTAEIRAREDARPPGSQPPSTLNSQPSTTFLLSAPMPVVEREEARARTELGAAQKDTARDLAAKLSSLKGIVWVGVGLFVFGLASLVYPPLRVIVASVTTSVALMLGGVALIVLPAMVVGNELLILGMVGLVVGAWFLAHRHGQLSGLVAASTASPSASSAPATAAPSPGAKAGNGDQGTVVSKQ
jgi:hypothetical protein